MLKTLQVTLGAAATGITVQDIPCKQVFVQNNSAHDCRVGDSNVSSTRGAKLLTASNGSITLGTTVSQNLNLRDIFILGTAADVIDVIYVE